MKDIHHIHQQRTAHNLQGFRSEQWYKMKRVLFAQRYANFMAHHFVLVRNLTASQKMTKLASQY